MTHPGAFLLQRQALLSCLQAGIPESAIQVGASSSGSAWTGGSLPLTERVKGGLDPLAIVTPESSDHISAAILCASKLEVAVITSSEYTSFFLGPGVNDRSTDANLDNKGGGRPYPPPKYDPSAPFAAEASLVIDLRLLRAISYDFHEQIVRVGAGASAGEVLDVLNKVGRMVPSPDNLALEIGRQVGNAAFGSFARSQGLVMDSVLSADMVLASGEAITVSKYRRPNLFWGIRGGGTSFGIPHSFTFRTTRISEQITTFRIALKAEGPSIAQSTAFVLAFQEWSSDAPRELDFTLHLGPRPGLGSSAESGDIPALEIMGQWMGEENGFEGVMQQIEGLMLEKQVGGVVRSQQVQSYMEVMYNRGNETAVNAQHPSHQGRHGHRLYSKMAVMNRPVTPTEIGSLLRVLSSLPTTPEVEWSITVPFLGGRQSAIQASEGGSSAFAHRDALSIWVFQASLAGHGSSADSDLVTLVEEMIRPLGVIEAVYPGVVDPELASTEYPRLIWGDLYPRLQALKKQCDPGNIFRHPQSIRPDQSSSWASIWLVLVVLAVLFWLVRHLRQRRRSDKLRRE